MREIKFQAYGHLESEHVYRMLDVDGFESYSGQLIPTYAGRIICDHTLRQYIGKEDKNQKHVYEGDLIKYEMSDSRKGGKYTLCMGKIQWNDDEACFEVLDLETGMAFDCELVVASEVIGNIYEDKQLLE